MSVVFARHSDRPPPAPPPRPGAAGGSRAPDPPPAPSRIRAVYELPLLALAPCRYFDRLAAGGRGAWPALLLVVVLGHVLAGWAVVTGGVVDYELEAAARKEWSAVARQVQEDGGVAGERLVAAEKGAAFRRLTVRLWWLVGKPGLAAVQVALTAAFLAGLVTLGGRKADGALLLGVAAAAALPDVLRAVAEAYLIAVRGTTVIDLSAAVWPTFDSSTLVAYLALRRADPFLVWGWVLLGLGAWRTGQLSAGGAIRAVALLAAWSVFWGVLFDFGRATNLTTMLFGF